MPYITQPERKLYDSTIEEIVEKLLSKYPANNGKDFSEGELNYIISSIVWKLFKSGKSYKAANKLLGVLNAVNLEFYRRQVVPYEEEKIIQNKDI